MPELVPTWRQLVELTGDDELAARMLTLWDPPPYVTGCSQAVYGVDGAHEILVRNYDYSPDLFERVIYSSRFTGRDVIGMSDCLWGLLDGMNDHGLAVSLTFGGRKVSGRGFGVQIIVRYLLETCDTVDEARAAIERLPVQCAYNIMLLDKTGTAISAQIAPDRPPVYRSSLVATNHQGPVDWHEYAGWTRTVERERWLCELLEEPGLERERLITAFLRPPLRFTGYHEGLGTLYTAVYRPADGIVDYRWPDATWRQSFADFVPGMRTISLPLGDATIVEVA
jgi:predicted choloylglycine hydrolase